MLDKLVGGDGDVLESRINTRNYSWDFGEVAAKKSGIMADLYVVRKR
jgi:hypothetical protein